MDRTVWKPIAGSLVFGLLWVVLAIASPAITYHLAPAIVAGWPSLAGRHTARGPQLAVAGFVIAAATTTLLSAAGYLDGPSLLPAGGAAAESYAAAAVGAAAGYLFSLITAGPQPST